MLYLNECFCNTSTEIPATRSIRCVENVYVQEMKVEITELKEALNYTRHHLDELRNKLNKQKKAITNLTAQVKGKTLSSLEP